MTNPTPPGAQRRAQQRIASRVTGRLTDTGFALPGTITRRMMRCGKSGCRCKADPAQMHGPYIQWTRTVDGKTVTKLLSEDQLTQYQPWFDNARELRELLTQLEAVSIEAITKAEGWGS